MPACVTQTFALVRSRVQPLLVVRLGHREHGNSPTRRRSRERHRAVHHRVCARRSRLEEALRVTSPRKGRSCRLEQIAVEDRHGIPSGRASRDRPPRSSSAEPNAVRLSWRPRAYVAGAAFGKTIASRAVREERVPVGGGFFLSLDPAIESSFAPRIPTPRAFLHRERRARPLVALLHHEGNPSDITVWQARSVEPSSRAPSHPAWMRGSAVDSITPSRRLPVVGMRCG